LFALSVFINRFFLILFFTKKKIKVLKEVLNPDFAVEIYYKKKMLQIQAFA